MCEPTTIALATMAIGAASSISAYAGQRQMAKQNKRFANLDKAQKWNVREMQRVQSDQKNAEERLSLAVQAAQSFGRIANAGLGAQTFQAYRNASAVAASRSKGQQSLNFRFYQQQVEVQKRSDEIARQNQIGQVPNPTLASLGLNLGKSALSAGTDYYAMGGA